MIYLLDVSSLLALLWTPHVHHQRVTAWQNTADLAICPITELGFVRISTQPAFGASVADAMKMLRDWSQARKPRFVDCDLEVPGMDRPPTGNRTTDFYLASLASKHGLRFATLDQDIKHKAAFLIPHNRSSGSASDCRLQDVDSAIKVVSLRDSRWSNHGFSVSHSQITITIHPSLRRARACILSRAAFPLTFSSHHLRRFVGVVQ